MNRASAMNEMFGLHGIDADPKLHPFARVDLLGRGCTADAECGGVGNRCTPTAGKKVCSAACTDDAGCPSPFRCKVTPGSDIKQCL